MTTIINASTSSGLVQTADTSGTLELQSNGTTQLSVSSTGVTFPAGVSVGYGVTQSLSGTIPGVGTIRGNPGSASNGPSRVTTTPIAIDRLPESNQPRSHCARTRDQADYSFNDGHR